MQGPYSKPQHWSNWIDWKVEAFNAGDSFSSTFTYGYPDTSLDAGTLYSLGIASADKRSSIEFDPLAQSVSNG